MLVLYFALGIMTITFLGETLCKQKRPYYDYFMWFLIVVSAMYAAKGYCNYNLKEEDFKSHLWMRIEEIDDLDDDDFKIEFYNVKFVPPGTPSNYINPDGTLSEVCLSRIRMTDKQTAYQSLALQRDKGEDCFNKAKDICWYLPDITARERSKLIFVSTIAMWPAPPHLKCVLATMALLTEYGICCIDAYYEVDFNMNMSKFHYMVAEAYEKHIKDKGW